MMLRNSRSIGSKLTRLSSRCTISLTYSRAIPSALRYSSSSSSEGTKSDSTNNGSKQSSIRKPTLEWIHAGGAAVTASLITFFVLHNYYYNDPSKLHPESINKIWPERKYGGLKEFNQAYPEFEKLLTPDRVTTDDEELRRHGYSEWSTLRITHDLSPIAVVYPTSTEEVSGIAKICHKYRLPMVGYSGGSSLEGNFTAPYGGICIDFTLMNKVIDVRPEDMDATVQPGVGWMDLNEKLKKDGINLFLPVDPGPIAKIGGMVSTSCSGTNCVRYGPMRNWVVNLTVVLADGSIIKTRQRPRKSSAGYNLNHLFAGAEGTLGLITEITVKLDVVPEKTSVAVCPFPKLRDATSTAIDIIRAGIPVHCVELMDDVQMWAINNSGYTEKRWDEKPTLFFKFSGSPAYIEEQVAKARKIAEEHNAGKFIFAETEKEGNEIWAARKESLWHSLALAPKGSENYATDVAVPMSKLADLIEESQKDLVDSGIAFATSLGHVGDGNFHASLIYNPKTEKEVAGKVAENINYRGLALEGTCTGEHGVGVGKVDYLVGELGTDVINLMHTIKMALDPYELLNPGKVFTKEALQRGLEKENNGTWGGKNFKFHKFKGSDDKRPAIERIEERLAKEKQEESN